MVSDFKDFTLYRLNRVCRKRMVSDFRDSTLYELERVCRKRMCAFNVFWL